LLAELAELREEAKMACERSQGLRRERHGIIETARAQSRRLITGITAACPARSQRFLSLLPNTEPLGHLERRQSGGSGAASIELPNLCKANDAVQFDHDVDTNREGEL
jgi:hypothetical protein